MVGELVSELVGVRDGGAVRETVGEGDGLFVGDGEPEFVGLESSVLLQCLEF